MAWGTKYRCEYYDVKGLSWKWDFELDGYSSTITAMKASGSPASYECLSDGDDILDNPVRGTKATLRVMASSLFQYSEFYTMSDLQMRCSIYYGAGDTLYFRGYILPCSFSEPYNDYPYEVSITAVCGLAALKNFKYEISDGVPYTGRKFESQILLDILGKINVTSFKEIVNIYEEDMDSGTSDSPMDQEYIECSDFDPKNDTCYDVLEKIISKWNALIRQRYGVFTIYRPLEMVTTAYVRTFTGATTKSGSTISTVTSIKRSSSPSADLRDINGGSLMMLPAAKKITLNHDYGWKDSWITGWEMKGEDFVAGAFKGWTAIGATDIAPLSTILAGEKDGCYIDNWDSSLPYAYGIEATFGANSVASWGGAVNTLGFEFDFLFFNSGASPITGHGCLIEITQGAYFMAIGADEFCDWLTGVSVVPMPFIKDAPVGSSGWSTFKKTVLGLPNSGDITIKVYCADNANLRVAVKNIKFYAYSMETSQMVYLTKLQGRGGRHEAPNLSQTGYMKIVQSVNIINILSRQYVIDNAANKEEIQRDYVLGDVTKLSSPPVLGDVNFENIIEQFAGALGMKGDITGYTGAVARVDRVTKGAYPFNCNVGCNGYSHVMVWNTNPATTVAGFISSYGGSFGSVILTDNYDGTFDFTANVAGVDFAAATIDGSTNSAANIIPNDVGDPVYAIAPTKAWNTRGGSEGDPLLELIGGEIGLQTSRPRCMLQLPVYDLDENDLDPHVDPLGCFVDDLNLYGGIARKFIFNAGTFDMKNRKWDIDMIEVIQ